MASSLSANLKADQDSKISKKASNLLGNLVQAKQYIGEVFSIGYEDALVQIHDKHRQNVGGIPSLSFLIATRLKNDQDFDFTKEDSSVLLLRVMDAAPLPNAFEAERIRVEVAQRAAGEAEHWDDPALMDGHTANILSFAGIKCRVLGTFYLEQRNGGAVDDLVLKFGSDISNYYPNRGLKVYKPNGTALSTIVNFLDTEKLNQEPLGDRRVDVGHVRYASTNRSFQGTSDVSSSIAPVDLLDQKTALFGMTRTGKSNTTKIIAKSVFMLRFNGVKDGKKSKTGDDPSRIGQLIFDPNGEYANENVQDASKGKNPNALKNVWQCDSKGRKEDVVTYGISAHPNDPDRKLMKLNFHLDANIQIGKEIVDTALSNDKAKYILNFVDVQFEAPDPTDSSATCRYKRRLLAYRALLKKAGFEPPHDIKPSTSGLFNDKLLSAMKSSPGEQPAHYKWAAEVLDKKSVTWDQIAQAMAYLEEYVGDRKSSYDTFNQEYMKTSTSGAWADPDLQKILTMFSQPNGPRQMARVLAQHTPTVGSDYADDIFSDLLEGKLVVVDQSSGEPELNRSAAERVMWKIFRNNQEAFRTAKEPKRILVYVEEAHNLLPSGSDLDLKSVWVRTAKEGSKYKIGMIYATQEVSSVHKNILKNTANWFIGHLNNTDETKELCKYYDFLDFEISIRRAQDKGFIRIKTLSNFYVIPVQVNKFEV